MQNDVHLSYLALAQQWATILAQSGCTSATRGELERVLTLLTKRLLSALSADVLDLAVIQTIGATLARFCHAEDAVLKYSQQFLAAHVLNPADAKQRSFQHHLVPVLTELAVGFVRQSRIEYALAHDDIHAEHLPSPLSEQGRNFGMNDLVTKLPIILFTTDRNGVITSVEGQGLERLGVTAASLLGRSVLDICQRLFPADAERILQNIQDTLGGSSTQSIGTAGDVVFEMHYDPVYDDRGAVIGIQGVALDITAYMQHPIGSGSSQPTTEDMQRSSPLQPSAIDSMHLSERELRVLRLVVDGKTNRAISQEFGVSERTIGTRIQSIIIKLGVKSRAEAIARATELGILR